MTTLQAVGVSPHLYTAIVIPVKSNSNKHERAQQKQKIFQDLWSQGLS